MMIIKVKGKVEMKILIPLSLGIKYSEFGGKKKTKQKPSDQHLI